jgi:hypothetical protein
LGEETLGVMYSSTAKFENLGGFAASILHVRLRLAWRGSFVHAAGLPALQ